MSEIVARDLKVRAELVASPSQLAYLLPKLIDHTILKPEATKGDVLRICEEALDHAFAAVCVSPCRVALARQALSGSPVRVCTVVGFPHGTATTEAKACEISLAVANGADEVDFVQNVGLVKDKNWSAVEAEYVALVAEARKASPAPLVKVILETANLTAEELEECCRLACACGINYVKTSTGYASRGANEGDILTMHNAVGEACGIKASGGVKTLKDAVSLVAGGATRLGTSSGVALAAAASEAHGIASGATSLADLVTLLSGSSSSAPSPSSAAASAASAAAPTPAPASAPSLSKSSY